MFCVAVGLAGRLPRRNCTELPAGCLQSGHSESTPAQPGKEILEERYGLNLVDVRPGRSGLRENRRCLEIRRVAGRIRQVGRHGQIDLHGQPPSDAADIGDLKRGSGVELARERKIENVCVRSLQCSGPVPS